MEGYRERARCYRRTEEQLYYTYWLVNMEGYRERARYYRGTEEQLYYTHCTECPIPFLSFLLLHYDNDDAGGESRGAVLWKEQTEDSGRRTDRR